ncbi:MAG: hypothetical protein ACREEM_12040 [Blastocatellia bacterium]
MKTLCRNRQPNLKSLFTSFAFCLITLASISSGSLAQSPDKIVKQAAKALGGEKNLRRVTSRQVGGVITRQSDGATGAVKMISTRPDLYSLAIEIGGFEAGEGFNGKSGWRRDSRAGLRTVTGVEASQFRAEAFHRNNLWLNYQKEKSKLAYAGQEPVGGKPAHAVVLTNARNVKIKMWFDAASNLPVKEELPAGDGVKTIEYSDHRAINGVMEPFTVKLSGEGEQFVITLDQVTHNKPADRAAFDFPKLSGAPLPDIDALLKQVAENQSALDELLEKYAYNSVITSREFDKSGALKVKETETFEHSFYRGRRIRRLVAKNDKPLSADEQAKEDRKLEKRIKEIEKREAEKEKRAEQGKETEEDDRRITIAEMLRSSKLTSPRRERYRQRDVVVFDFEPNPGYKPQKDFEKIMQKFSGAVWVDAGDRQVVRLEAKLIDSFKIGGGLLASIKPGGGFVMEQDRINNEIWLPTYSEFNLSARLLLVAGMSFNAIARYSNYKRFNVEAEKEKLKDPTKGELPNKP